MALVQKDLFNSPYAGVFCASNDNLTLVPPGIPKDDIVRVSERFFRSKTANMYKKNSSGLGLAIVKHIINRHAGSLLIESTEGKGSTFTITLPKFPASS